MNKLNESKYIKFGDRAFNDGYYEDAINYYRKALLTDKNNEELKSKIELCEEKVDKGEIQINMKETLKMGFDNEIDFSYYLLVGIQILFIIGLIFGIFIMIGDLALGEFQFDYFLIIDVVVIVVIQYNRMRYKKSKGID